MATLMGKAGEATSVRVLRTFAELEEIRWFWESLPGNRDSEMDPYISFLQSNPASIRPHVLAVYRDGKPVAILVGRIDQGPFVCRLGYLKIEPKARILVFVYGALRGASSPEICDLMVGSICQSLNQREADAAYMNYLKDGSDLWRAALQTPGPLSRSNIRTTQPHFAARLFRSADEYYRSLPVESKAFIRARQSNHKKLQRDFAGRIRMECFRNPIEIDVMARDVEQVAKTSYQRGVGVGFSDSEQMRQGLTLLASKGWLRAHVLYLEDQPCAFWIGDINHGVFGSDYVGFDPAFSKYSPGMFLIFKVIESFCSEEEDHVHTVDFAPGSAPYKEMLSNERWQESALYIYAPSLKGVSLNLIRTACVGADIAIKRFLESTGLLRRVKKYLRERARQKALPASGD